MPEEILDEQQQQDFDEKTRQISRFYTSAPELYAKGIHLISCDEKTGIQALQREILPMKKGLVQPISHEYTRHRTLCLIANFEVARGQIVAPYIKESPTEEDFQNHISSTIERDPQGEWIFIVDNLNTHKSESLVPLVANRCQAEVNLGEKGKSGILKSMATR